MLSKQFHTLNRRELIKTSSAMAGITALSGGISATTREDTPQFTHGVASGDPLQDRIILWTRAIVPAAPTKKVSGTWQLAKSADFSDIIAEGTFKTGPATDHTVKVDVTGLDAGTDYYYRFLAGEIVSQVGRTKTLPEDADQIDLAVVSCANYSHGYFNVYKEISDRDFQAVLHLGDYIYEYGVGKYENPEVIKQGRVAKPKTEAISLDQYRTRYAQYRTDPDLQAVHAAHPFICVWDDHEVANDSWKSGAENHTEEEGDYKERQKAAMQAYREWLPIRETQDVIDCKIYRTFELAQLGTLIMMDTRHIGRDKVLKYENDLPMKSIPFDMSDPDRPEALLSKEALESADASAVKNITVPFDLTGKLPAPLTDWATIKTLNPKELPKGYSYLPDLDLFHQAVLGAEERSILGSEQEEWVSNELNKSAKQGKPWQILGQQLLSGKLGIPQISDEELDYDNSPYVTKEAMTFFRMLGQMGMPLNLDAWDGYPACRERVFNSVTSNANNAVFLAGDTHNAWAFNLTDKNDNAVAVELGTPSVSSPGLEAYIPADPKRVAEELTNVSKELFYMNNENRGWLEVSVTLDELAAQWRFVSTVLQQDYRVFDGKRLVTKAGQHTLNET